MGTDYELAKLGILVSSCAMGIVKDMPSLRLRVFLNACDRERTVHAFPLFQTNNPIHIEAFNHTSLSPLSSTS
jgi:hypothetical protein